MTACANTPPRRILHVLKYYRPTFTGEGVFLERSSAVMQEVAGDVEHDLLVTHTTRPADPAAAGFCSTLRRVIYLGGGPLSTLRRQLRLTWWFLCHLRRYDTVHFRTHADWYFVTYLLTRLAGRRLVLSATLDDSIPVLVGHYRPRLRRIATLGFRLFHAYVSISPKLFQQTRAVIEDAARCHLVACGISLPPDMPGERARMRAALGIGPEDLVLLFVGGLCARKDPGFLIDALPGVLMRHPGARLLLVGPALEPDYLRDMERAVAAAGLGKAVIFAGEQLDPHPYFVAADVLVFASRLEGFGTVVPEAMAHGLPVVVRRLPGVNDSFVLHGETGFLFDDMRGYLDAVLRLAADRGLRLRIGAAGRALARREFDMRQVAARYLGIYGMAGRIRPAAVETGLGCTASIIDSRFHVPASCGPSGDPARTPLLITTVDAEEAFDWSSPLSRDAHDVSSMGSQHLAHRVFARHGVVPVYLADYPVAAQEAGRGPLRELLRDGLCDVGAQLHPWVTPPFTEEVGEDNSYAGNLPVAMELEKARRLTGVLGDAFGAAPLIYRTGRFGVGVRTADVLKRLGYIADSSVSPCWPQAAMRQGRDAWASSPGPYWVDREQSLMEIPVSAALVGRLAGRQGQRLAPLLFHPRSQRLRLAGAAAHMGLLERIRLTPEGMTIDEAKRLTRFLLAQGHRVFVLTYHSPSLVPGNTPYVRTLAQRERFLAWLDEYYAFFREEIGGRSATWREVRLGGEASLAAAAPAMAAAL
ncbi:glycosyltransferase involved in cell wall biosynthesis [Humitalea rosea]|uniref:Glycosyltransferase involved in cell wall biosynthesis n=1 Tax=Humitalea rosea TaxID=990373 RepID=A0A2W7ILY3_9PROT|nr:glycosyltransferase [Humitalea rosea]PZW46771.1 glycosyltransferase involved in cell wall biosynthesis [Humitalea rosea]